MSPVTIEYCQDAKVENCVFENSRVAPNSYYCAGGLEVTNAPNSIASNVTIHNTIFKRCQGRCGGFHLGRADQVHVDNATCWDNAATYGGCGYI